MGYFEELTEEKTLNKSINSKANVHASFLDFSEITYEWSGIFFA